MSEHLTEEEQIEAFKRWWNQYGTLTIGAVVVAAGAYFGHGAWESSKVKQAQANSALYDQLVTVATTSEGELTDKQAEALKAAAKEVIAAKSSGLYEDLARLQLAKVAVEQDDLAAAREALTEVVNNTKVPATRELANLRLARVLAAESKYDEALAIVSATPSEPFAAAFAEVKGDIYHAQGQLDQAYTAYESAVSALGEQSQGMRANILKFKMDNVRVATASPLAVSTEAAE